MTTTGATTTTELVAGELRATMARERITTTSLADRLGVSVMWVSRRLNGQTSPTLEDLDAICAGLGLRFVTHLEPLRGSV